MERREKKKDRFSKPSPEEATSNQTGKTDESGIPVFMRFTGVAFEMLGTIGLSTLAGYYIDKYLELRFPVFLISLSILSLIGSLYLLYKRLPKDQ